MEELEVFKTVVTFILAFVFVLVLAYFTTKMVVNVNVRKFKTKNMKLIEGINLGPQKSLQLVKVADKVVLIAVSKDNISKIETFDISDINYTEEEIKDMGINLNLNFFENILKKEMDKNVVSTDIEVSTVNQYKNSINKKNSKKSK